MNIMNSYVHEEFIQSIYNKKEEEITSVMEKVKHNKRNETEIQQNVNKRRNETEIQQNVNKRPQNSVICP